MPSDQTLRLLRRDMFEAASILYLFLNLDRERIRLRPISFHARFIIGLGELASLAASFLVIDRPR